MEKKKTPLHLPVGLQVAFGALFIVLTYIVNRFLHDNTDFTHSLAVGGSQIAAFYGYCYLIRISFDRGRRRYAGKIALLFSLVLPLAAPVLVYVLFPLLGIELQYANAEFDIKEFSAKVLIGLKTVWIGAGLYYVFCRKEMMGKRVIALEHQTALREKELVETKNDQLLNAGQSHYAKHVMTDVATRAALAGDTYTADQVTHIGKTFDYIAGVVQQRVPLVDIHRALSYFDQVVTSIRLRRGNDERIIRITAEGEPTMQTIGPLTLTTILENSDTHGLVDLTHPINVSFVFNRGMMAFSCANAKRIGGKKVESTGKGLELVKQELALLDRHDVKLEIREEEHKYTVCLTIIYN